MEIFQDLVALLAGLLVIGWWLADWVRCECVFVCIFHILEKDIVRSGLDFFVYLSYP